MQARSSKNQEQEHIKDQHSVTEYGLENKAEDETFRKFNGCFGG